ncbi:MAG: cell division protein FtsL [Bacilli bacterium]|nr:cell division protein FtsL [Bacilli bacterium]
MKTKKMKKVVKIGKFEKLIYSFAFLLLISSPFAVVFLQATLSKVNIEVEQIKKEIKTQEKKNESLSMKINELASLDKIIEVAHEQGLSYNNDNIMSVE